LMAALFTVSTCAIEIATQRSSRLFDSKSPENILAKNSL